MQPYKHTLRWRIGVYLRISRDDGNDESYSITNQRAFILDFIYNDTDFENAEVTEYVDDGISGVVTSREAYQQLLSDVRNGHINCIVSKDLSRIGRQMIEVGDLLMNELAARKVRFIAINNGYDSLKHPLSNLELALTNLLNQHYVRDLVEKSRASRHMKWKKGEFLGRQAPYGYKKSTTIKNKLEIDDEVAGYVRMIFSLAIDGHTAPEIARMLNVQGIPTPGEYKQQQGIVGGWKVSDPDYSFWNNRTVWSILNDERYTGKAINNVRKVKAPSSRTVQRLPRSEWIIVPNAHDAIVSDEVFNRAKDAMRRTKMAHVSVEHIFFGKIRCPVCKRTMTRSSKMNPHFCCATRRYTDHYCCPDIRISQATIEKAVLESIKAYAKLLIDREEVRLKAVRRANMSKAEIESQIKSEGMAIRLLEDSITRIFTELAEDKISQDAFLEKKRIINNTIEQKLAEVEKLHFQADAISTGKGAISSDLESFRSWEAVEKLDREIIDLLIDRVVVHGEHEIEVVWADEV